MKPPTLDQIMRHVTPGPPDECWSWTGPVNRLRDDRPTAYARNATRWLWVLTHGEPPDGWHVEHTCENRRCVNLGHLAAVPAEVNFARLRRTHCKRGHELTDDNRVDAGPTGHGESRRYKCRLCSKQREQERTARRRRAGEAVIG
jgi:hypothetical protein